MNLKKISPNKKVVLLDDGYFMFTAIHLSIKNPEVNYLFAYTKMIVACLRRLALTEDDIVILAVDSSLGSWRRDVDSNYKSNRAKTRDALKDVDWPLIFEEFKAFKKMIDRTTPFHVIEVDRLEADDIIAYFALNINNEVVIVSSDTDYEMLTVKSNVKIMSPKTKTFKQVKNPYQVLAQKIKKERTDNLITAILTEEDYEKRNKIVNLLELPEEIKQKIEDKIGSISFIKNFNMCLFPFGSDLIYSIYTNHIKMVEHKKKIKIKQESLF